MQSRSGVTAGIGALTPDYEPFLTTREVAERLRISPSTVLRYFDEGTLPGRRLHRGPRRPVRFRWSEVEAAVLRESEQ